MNLEPCSTPLGWQTLETEMKLIRRCANKIYFLLFFAECFRGENEWSELRDKSPLMWVLLETKLCQRYKISISMSFSISIWWKGEWLNCELFCNVSGKKGIKYILNIFSFKMGLEWDVNWEYWKVSNCRFKISRNMSNLQTCLTFQLRSTSQFIWIYLSQTSLSTADTAQNLNWN